MISSWPRFWVEGVRKVDSKGLTHIYSQVDYPADVLYGMTINVLCGLTLIQALYVAGPRCIGDSVLRGEPSAVEDEPICDACLKVFVHGR